MPILRFLAKSHSIVFLRSQLSLPVIALALIIHCTNKLMLQSLFSLTLAEVSILGQTLWRQQTGIKWALIAHNLCRSLSARCKSTADRLWMPELRGAFSSLTAWASQQCLEEIFNSELKAFESIWGIIIFLFCYFFIFKLIMLIALELKVSTFIFVFRSTEICSLGTKFSFARQTFLWKDAT